MIVRKANRTMRQKVALSVVSNEPPAAATSADLGCSLARTQPKSTIGIGMHASKDNR